MTFTSTFTSIIKPEQTQLLNSFAMLTRILTALTIIATASVVVAMPVEQAKRGTVRIFYPFIYMRPHYNFSLGGLRKRLVMHRERWDRLHLRPYGFRHLRQLHGRAYLPEQRSVRCRCSWWICLHVLLVSEDLACILNKPSDLFLYSDFGCNVGQGGGVSLTSGSWSMFNVPGTAGHINFNDQASSLTCSPV